MMRLVSFALAALLAIAPTAAAETRTLPGVEDAYKSTAFIADPMPAIDAALAAARQSGKRVLLVMGTGGFAGFGLRGRAIIVRH